MQIKSSKNDTEAVRSTRTSDGRDLLLLNMVNLTTPVYKRSVFHCSNEFFLHNLPEYNIFSKKKRKKRKNTSVTI